MGAIALACAASASHADLDPAKIRDLGKIQAGPITSLADPFATRDPLPASGVTICSNVPVNNFAGNHAGAISVWSYVAPSGREYALLTLTGGTGVVEVTDPASPRIIATIPGPANYWREVKVVGDRAYAVSEGGGGVQVIDLSRVDEGIATEIARVQQGGQTTAHTISANVESNTLYVNGANVANGGLLAMDLSNPDAPAIAGAWTESYVHDSQIVTWTDGPYAGREIAFCAAPSRGLVVVDCTDKSNMVTLASVSYSTRRYTHQCWLSEDRTRLFLCDERDERDGVVPMSTTYVFNVINPASPVLIGSYQMSTTATDHNLMTRDGYVFVAGYRSGLRIVAGASDPATAHEIGFVDTFPNDDDARFNGAWGIDTSLPSGVVLIADTARGLFVLWPDCVRESTLRFTVLPETPTNPGDSITAETIVGQAGVAADPTSVRIVASIGGQDSTLPMTPLGQSKYEASLPDAPDDVDVSYRVEARAIDGRWFTSDTFVVQQGVAPCPADLSGDRVLDSSDFLAFLTLYASGDSAADLDADGSLTSGDFLSYLNLYTQGCH
ncbi:MAG: choice-of-anchor B family protein [Phycisphaerales bacterium]|nr:choice-of-anchor B family protein [Phycisphaerales bacterium]